MRAQAARGRAKTSQFAEIMARLHAELLRRDVQAASLERRFDLAPALGGVFDRHSFLAQLHAEIEARHMTRQVRFQGVGQIGIGIGVRPLAAVPGLGDQGVLDRLILAEQIWRGAPVADIQRRVR